MDGPPGMTCAPGLHPPRRSPWRPHMVGVGLDERTNMHPFGPGRTVEQVSQDPARVIRQEDAMTETALRIERRGRVVILENQDPPRNRMTFEYMDELERAVSRCGTIATRARWWSPRPVTSISASAWTSSS